MRAAVFSCLGLGDGLISSVLANNLRLNGYETTLFHPFLSSMQSWFPYFSIHPFPDNLDKTLQEMDQIFIFLEKSPSMAEVISLCLQKHRKKTTILNPIATAKRDYPYWEEGKFDGTKPFVENLYRFCADTLLFPVRTKSNGIVPPDMLTWRKEKKRVLLHPTSSRLGKNWPLDHFLSLADALEQKGFSPVFLLTKQEKDLYPMTEERAPLFHDLPAMASYLYESGYLIGNDSGPGHLASCLHIPSLLICRSAQTAQFWRPGWRPSLLLFPSRWIPNIKGIRWRDRYWQKWISKRRVLHCFFELCKTSDK